MTNRQAAWTTFGALVAVYLCTTNWQADQWWNDTLAAAIGAHAIGTTGTPSLPDPDRWLWLRWMIDYGDGVVVPNRFPGMMYLAAPVSAVLAPTFGLRVPALLVAVVATAGGATLLGWSLADRFGRRTAVTTALLIGLGTPAWGIASEALWTHGPGLLFLGAGVYALSRDRLAWAGLAFAAAVPVRPHYALVPAVVGVLLSVWRRSWRPVAALALSGLGAASYVLYNGMVHSAWTLTGGYGPGALPAYTRTVATTGLLNNPWVSNLLGATVSPARGAFLQAPILWWATSRRTWRQLPDWTRAVVLGGIVYAGVQLAANRYTGGAAQETFRVLTEPAALACLVAGPALVRWAGRWQSAIAVAVAVGVQATAAIAHPAGLPHDSVTFWPGDWWAVPGWTVAVGIVVGAVAAMAWHYEGATWRQDAQRAACRSGHLRPVATSPDRPHDC